MTGPARPAGEACSLERFSVRRAAVGAREDKAARASQIASMLDGLKATGLKRTAQREAIVRMIAGDLTHPTAQELYERLRPSFPSMSFATVYNTLGALSAAGLSRTLHLGGAARFDPNTAPHHHAVCDACGAITDLPTASLEADGAARRAVRDAAPGFSVREVEHVYRGTCARCERSASAG